MFRAPDPSASPFPADLLSPRGIQQLLAQRGALTGVSNKTHPERLLGRLKLLLKNIILESQVPSEDDVIATSECLQTLKIPLDVLAAARCLPQVSIFSNLLFGSGHIS